MKTIGFTIALLLCAISVNACDPDTVSVAHNSGDGVIICPRGNYNWQQNYQYKIICDASGDTLAARSYPMRCDGAMVHADSLMDILADQMGADYLNLYLIGSIDWKKKLARAHEEIKEGDLDPTFQAFADSVKTLESPTRNQVGATWRTVSKRLSWVIDNEQADSLWCRYGDKYNMTGEELADYVIEHRNCLE